MARFDEIGSWSEVKLSIIKEYCSAYSTILTKQPHPFHHIYIDAFAGSGQHISKSSGKLIPGSRLNALEIFLNFSMMDMKRNVLLKNIETEKRVDGLNDFTVICRKLGVIGHEWQPVYDRLRNNHPVERILMVKR